MGVSWAGRTAAHHRYIACGGLHVRAIGVRILLLLATATGAVVLPAGSATAKVLRLPDLVITKITITELPGTPPYIVVDNRDNAPGFVVRVVTMNVGNAVAKKSRTELSFETGGKPVRGYAQPVPELPAHTWHTSVFTIDDLRPPLGWLTPKAEADIAGTVRESHEGRANTKTLRFIPVIAQRWNVKDLMITDNIGGGGPFPGGLESDATRALDGFVFRFSRFDRTGDKFVYIPDGPIHGSWNYVYAPLSCTGSGSIDAPNQQWPGYLWLEEDLSSYEVLVDTSSQPPQISTISCMGKPILPMQWKLQQLEVFEGVKQKPQMSPSDKKLTGLTTQPGIEAGSTTTWQWTFSADVP